MLDWFRALLRRHVAADVPDELSACLNCRVRQCSEARWATCPRRLAEAAALRALRQGQPDAVSPS